MDLEEVMKIEEKFENSLYLSDYNAQFIWFDEQRLK